MAEATVAVFLAPGCEEIEALTVVDILYRAGIACETVSVAEGREVTSSHGVTVVANKHVADADLDAYDMLVLPGGIPGTPNLHACKPLMDAVHAFAAAGRPLSAICAAPSIFAEEGLLEGRRATSNPGFQHVLAEHGTSVFADEPVVVDGNFITSQGMGTAIDFALEIVRHYKGDDEVARLKGAVVYWER
ncbi:MAG: DJ-1/PfpI family protein [Atopobiaceae bacterium]|nr:DJ-1/PfpI family protein [Atopobiaceae bacterium]